MIKRFPRYAISRPFKSSKIYPVPVQYRQRHPFPYPPSNSHEFERWFHDTIRPDELTGERIYLPIFWTAYWLKNGYGKKLRERNALQAFVNALPKDKQYFTICQYDDGPMVDFGDLDIKVFGMSGGRIDYPIPLLCMPHPHVFSCARDILVSFIGSDTHPVRRELVTEFTGKKDCLVTMQKYPLKDYCNILARSVFALCPRGYGKSSFRIAEAIQYGAIPVYISDSCVIPYEIDFNIYGLCFSSVAQAKKKLLSMGKDEIKELQQAVQRHKYLFTYQGCKKKILENI